MRKFMDAHADWLTVVQLPAYASELNAVESVKRSIVNNAVTGIDDLVALVKNRLRRMQYRPDLLDGLLGQTRLTLQPDRHDQHRPRPFNLLHERRRDHRTATHPAPRKCRGGHRKRSAPDHRAREGAQRHPNRRRELGNHGRPSHKTAPAPAEQVVDGPATPPPDTQSLAARATSTTDTAAKPT